MTIWAQTDFTGGAVGASITTTTEPVFVAVSSPNPTYGQAKDGTHQGLRFVSTSANGQIDLGGRTEVRVGYKFYRVSGTQTSYLLLTAFRAGSTVLCDFSVRNQGGGQPAVRDNFSWTHQLTTDSVDNTEEWYVELHWKHGISLVAYLWKDGTAESAPADYTLTAPLTLTTTPTNFLVGHSNAATGVTGVISELKVSDGEAIRGASITITTSGTATAQATASGVAAGVHTTSATATAQAAATGTAESARTLSGTATATAAASAALTSTRTTDGTATAQATASGVASSSTDVTTAGTATAHATATGAATTVRTLSGTATAQAAATVAATSTRLVSEIALAVAAVSAFTTSTRTAAGSAQAVASASGEVAARFRDVDLSVSGPTTNGWDLVSAGPTGHAFSVAGEVRT